ncbi:MAG: hypothetical protein ACK41Y_02950 [Paracoccus hibiscisoli]|uniref:hypothetical protein n=1 Tax=Paracoccus hibiscisoli TaxID=2023261 RepID=UPI00391D6661
MSVVAADLRNDVRLAFDRIVGVAELMRPILDATCDNPLQRRMLETLAASLESFVNEGLILVDRLEAEGGAA